MTPLSAPEAQQLAGDIAEAQLREAIHCFDVGGRAFRGARALRHVAMRLPLMLPFALILWVPGVIFVAERVYAWISRHRHLLSSWFGCTTACRLLPDRKIKANRREGG